MIENEKRLVDAGIYWQPELNKEKIIMFRPNKITGSTEKSGNYLNDFW
jgi:hypothetical protein